MADEVGSFCSECGMLVPEGATFCPSCGTQRGAAGAVVPPAPPIPAAPPPPMGAAPTAVAPGGGGGRGKALVAVAVVAILVIVAVALGGGGGGSADDADDAGGQGGGSSPTTEASDATVTDADEPGSWTVMVYVMGDTDLEEAALIDLEEMAAVGSGPGLSIVTLVDRSPDYTDDPVAGIDDWESTKTFEVGDGELIELDDHGELNLGDPDVLADFIDDTVDAYPADHYGLVLWDHGAGWIGMGPDESDGDLLELREMSAGIEDGLERADLASLDLVGFDACAMATYEVASEMSPFASYLLASEELEPGHGWDYRSLAEVADGRADARDVGGALLDGYLAQAQDEGQDQQITLSLVDLQELDPLHDAISELADAVADDPSSLAASFGIQRAQTISFGRDPNPENDLNLTDLGAFTAGLADLEPDLTDLAGEVDDALADVVVGQVTGPAAQDASGLSVYFPQVPEHLHPGYDDAAGGTPWGSLLDTYLSAGAAIPDEAHPEFTNPGREAEWFFDEDGLNMFGTFDVASEDNLTEAIIYYGMPDPSDGSIIFYGEEPGEILRDGTGTAGVIYDLTLLRLSDGEDEAFAYLDLSLDEEENIATFDVPLAYYPPGSDEYQDVVLSVVMDLDTEEFTETYYVFQEEGSVGELDADPDGIIVPIVLNQYPDGSLEWIPTTDVGLWAELVNITYEFVPLESGTELYAELTVFDYGGNSDFVSMLDVVP